MARGRRTEREPRYEERIVLFIDFLGFKAAVAKTETGEVALRNLISALEAVGSVEDSNEDLPSQMVTQFSDSVVVSYLIEEESAVFWLLHAIALCVVEVAERGFLLRGAVTRGLLLHNDRHVVGPALVRAYEMESQLAVQPRVIVDTRLLAVARRFRAEHHEPGEEETYVRALLRRDADGILWLDYVRWTAVVDVMGCDNDAFPQYLARIGGMVAAGLHQADAGVASKYLWLHGRYLEAVGDFDDGYVRQAYVAENPEVVDAIRALPRYEDEAAMARETVDAASHTL